MSLGTFFKPSNPANCLSVICLASLVIKLEQWVNLWSSHCAESFTFLFGYSFHQQGQVL